MGRKVRIGQRLREIREELYGERGVAALAAALDLPAATWLNFERGVMMPADVMLEFLVLTGADPNWLLTGEGDRTAARRLV